MTTRIAIPTSTATTITVTTDLSRGVNVGIPVRDHNTHNNDHTNKPIKPIIKPTIISPTNPSLPSAIPPPSITATPCNAHVEAFWLPGAIIKPVEIGGWVGSIEKGGANVNCNLISFCPHGCGTHTECLGHISCSGTTILDHSPSGIGLGIEMIGGLCSYKEFKEMFYKNSSCSAVRKEEEKIHRDKGEEEDTSQFSDNQSNNNKQQDNTPTTSTSTPLKKSQDVNYINSIPVNDKYHDDDVVVGDIKVFLSSLVGLIELILSHHHQEQKRTPRRTE